MQMKYFKIIQVLILGALISFSQLLFGQKHDFDLSKVKEKIEISTDRDLYFSGEEIYFSADYLVNGLKVDPAPSTVLYVELINCRTNQPIVQKKYRIGNNHTGGRLTLPGNVETGNYYFRAYTRYMRNFSTLEFGHHFLTILNPKDSENSIPVKAETDSIEIVPEGNILLDKVENTLVIKVPRSLIDEENRYYIVDEQENILETLNGSPDGFATAEFTGTHSHNYRLMLLNNAGDSIFASFPEIKTEGVQTRTKINGEYITYSVTALSKNPTSEESLRMRVVDDALNVLLERELTFSQNHYQTEIPVESLGKGIRYIVLFDADGKVLRINSVFRAETSKNKIGLAFDKNRYKPREKVTATISLDDEILKKSPVLSVSVSRNGARRIDYRFDPAKFSNGFLLADYLNRTSETNTEQIRQFLILADKYLDKSRFERKNQDERETKLKYVPEIYDITISGIVRNKETGKPAPDQKVFASVLFDYPQFHVDKSRENGAFIFSLNNAKGFNDVFLCLDDSAGNKYEILVSNAYSTDYPEFSEAPVFFDVQDSAILREIFVNAQISEYFADTLHVTGEKNRSVQGFNIDNNKSTTVLADFVSLKNMEELFVEVVPAVTFKRVNGRGVFAVFDVNGNLLSENPLILLDRIPIFDPDKIMQLDVSGIEKVEVINTAYILGENTFYGVLMITTKTDNFAGIDLPKSSVFLDYQTLENSGEKQQLFSVDPPDNRRLPYFKTTLFWESGIAPGNNAYTFDFRTSDRKGVYNVEIEGVTIDGEKLHCKKQIVVE